jgi:hypothetical protein
MSTHSARGVDNNQNNPDVQDKSGCSVDLLPRARTKSHPPTETGRKA